MIIMFASCATKRHITSSTTTTDIISDSASQCKNMAEEMQVEWYFDGEEASGITDTTNIPKWLKPILPSTDKPPRKGKLRITISKHFSSSSQLAKVEKSAKIKKKEKTKTTEKSKENVKTKNWKWLVILIIVIIFGFIVKFVLQRKKNR